MINLFKVIQETRELEAAKPESERAFRLTEQFGRDIEALSKVDPEEVLS